MANSKDTHKAFVLHGGEMTEVEVHTHPRTKFKNIASSYLDGTEDDDGSPLQMAMVAFDEYYKWCKDPGKNS